MIAGLVDTTILVDVLRGYNPAATWLPAQPQLAITPTVWMEVLAGAPDKPHQRTARKLLAQFNLIYLTEGDQTWAMQQLLAYRLSHQVGILDCLIASVSRRLQLPLYTINLKHFTPLLGDLARKPY
jgi:tRNA(fMet)-specific endonuclease VapC